MREKFSMFTSFWLSRFELLLLEIAVVISNIKNACPAQPVSGRSVVIVRNDLSEPKVDANILLQCPSHNHPSLIILSRVRWRRYEVELSILCPIKRHRN